MTKTMETSGGCDCAIASAKEKEIYRSPEAANDPPVVCTADLADRVSVDAQMNGYRDAFRALVRSERNSPNAIAWTFRNEEGLAGRLRVLAKNEHECCAFFAFDLRESAGGDEIVWSITAPSGAREVLEAFAELPTRLAAGADTKEIKDHVTQAGLLFAADRRP